MRNEVSIQKSENIINFEGHTALKKKQQRRKVKCIQIDNSLEYMNIEFDGALQQKDFWPTLPCNQVQIESLKGTIGCLN